MGQSGDVPRLVGGALHVRRGRRKPSRPFEGARGPRLRGFGLALVHGPLCELRRGPCRRAGAFAGGFASQSSKEHARAHRQRLRQVRSRHAASGRRLDDASRKRPRSRPSGRRRSLRRRSRRASEHRERRRLCRAHDPHGGGCRAQTDAQRNLAFGSSHRAHRRISPAHGFASARVALYGVSLGRGSAPELYLPHGAFHQLHSLDDRRSSEPDRDRRDDASSRRERSGALGARRRGGGRRRHSSSRQDGNDHLREPARDAALHRLGREPTNAPRSLSSHVLCRRHARRTIGSRTCRARTRTRPRRARAARRGGLRALQCADPHVGDQS